MDLKELLKKEMNLSPKLSNKEKYQKVEAFAEKLNNVIQEIKEEVYPNEPCRLAKTIRNHYLKHPIDCKPFDFLLLCYGTDLFFNNFTIEHTTNESYSWGLDVVVSESDIRFSFSLREDARLLMLEELEEMMDLNPKISDYIKINNYTHDPLFRNCYSKKVAFSDAKEVIEIIDNEFARFKTLAKA